ncbi:MAG TPA: sialidase family protein [Hanamia sp.]|nr:sialidase family protein [Hanamia sp.]
MRLFTIFVLSFIFCCCTGCKEKKAIAKPDFVIGNGQIPDIVKDKSGVIHLVYGLGDSVMYTLSVDDGQSFSAPSVVAVLPAMYSFAMRGPQIAVNNAGVIITACTKQGNIFSYYKDKGSWKQGARVNDIDTVAKEGLMALAADGENAFAVWLDVRGNERNKIYGARSTDGGKSWSQNIMVYTSPDTSVCPCCKPSVVMNGQNVYVMFRNWLQGNRDLYLTESTNNGQTFSAAQKLGNRSWKLNACPMDGGGLAINKNGKVQTVWRREGNIFTAIPGIPEVEIGQGRNCSIATVNNKNIFAWTDDQKVICMEAGGQKKVIGKGSLPVIKALNDEHAICIWQDDKQIHASVVAL